MFPKKTILDVPLDGKTVLVRVDFNVPLTKNGKIADDFRMVQSLPTIKNLIERHCRVVLCAHLGRPKGAPDPKLSLEPVAKHLSELLGQPVLFVPTTVGDQTRQMLKQLTSGGVALLENLRFNPGEKANDSAFASQLKTDTGAQYFVQDGFGVVHRADASTSAITQVLPSVAGLLLKKEYVAITSALAKPKRPFVAILGGAKVSDKITVIQRFIDLADQLIIGGAMANTFLKFRGYNIGKSVFEEGLESTLHEIYEKAAAKVGESKVDDFLLLPSDVAVATAIEPDAKRTEVSVDDVQDDQFILDLGAHSIEAAKVKLTGAGTAIWSGTMGYAELPQFAHGSARIALQLATSPQTTSIVGGGDTADFVLHWDAKKGGSFTHVSTGGSASIELMAGKKLPGIEALL